MRIHCHGTLAKMIFNHCPKWKNFNHFSVCPVKSTNQKIKIKKERKKNISKTSHWSIKLWTV